MSNGVVESHTPASRRTAAGSWQSMLVHRAVSALTAAVVLMAAFVVALASPAAALTPSDVASGVPSRGYVANGTVRAIVVGGGYTYLGGDFTSIDGIARSRLARLSSDGSLDMTWNPAANGPVHALAVSGSAVYVGGSFTAIGGTTRNRLARIGTNGSLDGTWSPSSNGTVLALAVSGTHVYAGGEGAFSTRPRESRTFLARFNADGSLDITLGVSPNDAVNALAVSGADVYIGGRFFSVNGQTRRYLARIGTNGTLSSTWVPQASYFVYALAVSGSDVYAGGGGGFGNGFLTLNRNYLARIDSNGIVSDWNPNPNDAVHALALSGSDVYASGFFTTIGGIARNRLARIGTDGSVDSAWNPNADNVPIALAASDTDVYVGGAFTTFGGGLSAAHRLAQFRLRSTSTLTFSSLPPAGAPARSPFTVSVELRDGAGVPVTGAQVSLSLADGATGLSGPLTATTSDGIASFTGLEMAQPGPVTLVASAGGVTSVTASLSFGKAPQTITFEQPAAAAYGDPAVSPGASSSAGLPVSYTSSTLDVCIIEGSSVVLAGVGTCTITTSQPGDAIYAAAESVTRSFEVGRAEQSISFGTIEDQTLAGTSFTLDGSATSGLTVTYSASNDGSDACSIVGAVVNLDAEGVCTVTASQAGNTNYLPAPQVTRSFSVSKADQTITFAPLAGITFSDDAPLLEATASSGAAITYTVDAASSCSVSDSALTVDGAGSCTVTAWQDGTSRYNAATPVSRTFSIAKAPQTVTLAGPANKVFGAAPFAVTASASTGMDVTVTVAPGSPCSYAGGTVTLTGAGTCELTATQAGDANYQLADKSLTIAVAKAPQTLTFAAVGDQTMSVRSVPLLATTTSLLPISYTVDFGPCTVVADRLTLDGAGDCSVIASQAGDDNWHPAAPLQQTFNISKDAQQIEFSEIPPATYGAADVNLLAYASATSNEALSFATHTPAVCSFEGASTLKIRSAGMCSVTASQAGTDIYQPAEAVTRSFSIGQASQSIALSVPAARTYGDGPFAVTATASSNLPVTVEAAAGSSCTLDGSLVTITSAGDCVLTASQPGDGNYTAADAVERTIAIGRAPQSITFGALLTKSATDPSFQLQGTASSGLPLSYAVSAGSACLLDGTTLSPDGSGTCSVTATQNGNDNYLPAESVTQMFSVSKANQTITFGALDDATYGDAARTLVASATSGAPVTFSVDEGDGCSVTDSTLRLDGAGSCTVTASQPGTRSYNGAEPVLQSFTIARAPQAITFLAPTNKVYGVAPFTLDVSSSSPLAVSVQADADSACTVSGTTVTLTGAGSCSLTATQAGDGNYELAPPVTRAFTIAKAPSSITFAELAGKTFGDTDFTVSANSSAGTTVTFAAQGSCTVSGSLVHLTGGGSCAVTASAAGSTDYFAAPDVTRAFTIGKAGQTITFTSPASKSYGDPAFTVTPTASSGLDVTVAPAGGSSCSVSGTTVSLTGAGPCTLVAHQSGNDSYAAAPEISRTVTVAAAPLRITASSQTLASGDTPSPVSPLYSGLVGSDTGPTSPPVCSTTATASSRVGSYSSTCADAGDPRYVISYATGAVTVIPGVAAAVTELSGGGQSATTGSSFASPLVAVVTDVNGNLVPNVTVTFTLTAASTTSGSATFAGGVTSAVVTTGSTGQATSPAITAGATGPITATATSPAATTAASFLLSSTPPQVRRVSGGYLSPVRTGDAVTNIVKGGSTVPLKFAVRDETPTSSTTVTDPAQFTFSVAKYACDASDTSVDVIATTTGGTALRYDAVTGTFIQNWQTPRTLGCYRAEMRSFGVLVVGAQFKVAK